MSRKMLEVTSPSTEERAQQQRKTVLMNNTTFSPADYAPKISLADILSEELARKLQEEENARMGYPSFQPAVPVIPRPVIVAAPRPAWGPAKKVTAPPTAPPPAASLNTSPPAITPTSSPSTKRVITPPVEVPCAAAASSSSSAAVKVPPRKEQVNEDDDFALALRLQEQFDLESKEVEAHMRNKNAKVSSVSVPLVPSLVPAAASSSSSVTKPEKSEKTKEEEEEEYEDEYEEEDEDSDDEDEDTDYATEKKVKLYHQLAKTNGRVARSDFYMMTKHDEEVASKANTDYLRDGLPNIAAGNMRGSDISIPTTVFNAMKEHSRKVDSRRVKKKNLAEDVETAEQVLDKRTRLMLYKLINNQTLESVNGIISTGKESNVYHGVLNRVDEEGADLGQVEVAVKIFKTTMSEFKNRSEYMESALNRQNPRKVVKIWAEKELANLKKLREAGVRCPQAVLLREHILVMTFIGAEGRAAPQLKEAEMSEDKLYEVYLECICAMRTMYQHCHLVHADLSEYNMLLWKSKLYFIDVSQAVEPDHPNALEFLRRDCQNIFSFFRRRGVSNALRPEALFNFITDPSLKDEDVDAYLDRLQEVEEDSDDADKAEDDTNNTAVSSSSEKQTRAATFANKNLSIPHSLKVIEDPFALTASVAGSFHHVVTGQRVDGGGAQTVPAILEDVEEEDEGEN